MEANKVERVVKEMDVCNVEAYILPGECPKELPFDPLVKIGRAGILLDKMIENGASSEEVCQIATHLKVLCLLARGRNLDYEQSEKDNNVSKIMLRYRTLL